jgi:hypothetical protein
MNVSQDFLCRVTYWLSVGGDALETGFPSRGRKNRQRLTSVWHATHPCSLSHPRCKTLPVKKAGNTISPICRPQTPEHTNVYDYKHKLTLVDLSIPYCRIQNSTTTHASLFDRWAHAVASMCHGISLDSKNVMEKWWMPCCARFSSYSQVLRLSHSVKGIVMSCSCKGVWSLHNVLFLDTTVMIAQSPLKKTKEKAHNSFSQWPRSTVFRSRHLLDKQLKRRSSSSLNVRLVAICDCTAMNKKSAVSTELVSSPDTEQKLPSISSPQSSRSLILWRCFWRSCIFPNQHKCDLDACNNTTISAAN